MAIAMKELILVLTEAPEAAVRGMVQEIGMNVEHTIISATVITANVLTEAPA